MSKYFEVDHIAVTAEDPAELAKELGHELQIEFIAGGGHPNLATKNMLSSFSDRSYLELVGPSDDAEEDSAIRQIAHRIGRPEIVMFAIETFDARGDAATFRRLGWELIEWSESRTRPDGEVLNYRGFTFVGHSWGGLVPFFIDWQGHDHPGKTSPRSASLQFAACTSRPQELKSVYKNLGLEIEVRYSTCDFSLAFLNSSRGEATLYGSAENQNIVNELLLERAHSN